MGCRVSYPIQDKCSLTNAPLKLAEVSNNRKFRNVFRSAIWTHLIDIDALKIDPVQACVFKPDKSDALYCQVIKIKILENYVSVAIFKKSSVCLGSKKIK